jgi:pimeloyl-ACP methyl ester carboxylesterase
MKSSARFIKIILLVIALLLLLIAGFYGQRDIPVEKLKATYAQSPSSFISIDGMDVHYRDEGKLKDTLPLVLIHGTGSSLHTFNDWSAVLKNDYRVIRMDLPGFGLTGPFPDRNYSIGHYVDFVEHFLSAKGIKRCILGGNSLGGEIAWRFTLKYPEMVDKLILIDAAGYPKESKSVPIGFRIARIPVLNKLLTFITPRSMVKASVENVYADKTKVTEPLVERYFKLTLREGNRQALVDRMTLALDTTSIHLITNIQQPTLILWGEDDLLIPVNHAHLFHDDLPNDTLVILKNMGHVPMEESPLESLAPILDLMKH